jgi:lipopolysaccharide/colanic/teichoic acid biosynthesis glycosyltransferase
LVKRAFDLVLGTAILAALAPLLGILMAAVRLSRRGPALFRQARVMGAGRTAAIVKLRTVTGEDSDDRWTVPPAACSRLGRWLRMTHLDELPQLLNVVRGEMSLVGPRPERPYFAAQFAEVIPRYDDRHRTPGGMTGWAQVHGLYGDTSIAERARFDNHYIENWSLWLDVVILARTLAAPLAGTRRRHRNRGGRP